MSCVNAAFEVSKSFFGEIFVLHPWLVISFFRPLNSLFNMFADLTNLCLSSLSVNCKHACVIGLAGHLIVSCSVDIPIVVVISFSMSCTSRREIPPLRLFSGSGLLVSCALPCRSLSSRFLCCFGLPAWALHSGDFFVHSAVFVITVFFQLSIVVFIPCSCNPTDCTIVSFVCFIIFLILQSYSLEIPAISFPFSLLIFSRHCLFPF